MSLSKYLIWSPCLFGPIYVGVSFLDVYLFDAQLIVPDQMLINELIAFFISLVSVLASIGIGIYLATKRNWKQAIVAVPNFIIFTLCFFVGSYNGYALIYAT